jgi:hypothetical protein
MGDATRVKVERSAKRVRAYLGGEIIVDSVRSKLVWEVPQYPAYYFPMADVRMHHSPRAIVSSGRPLAERRATSMYTAETEWPRIPHGITRNRLFSRFKGTYVSNGIRWTLGLRKRKKCSSTPTIRISASTFCTVLATSRFRSMA